MPIEYPCDCKEYTFRVYIDPHSSKEEECPNCGRKIKVKTRGVMSEPKIYPLDENSQIAD
ncbi:MAG: hypothetical protein PHY72_02935 [Candidatus Pacebacteria bacterium]|nr:hypothetical protein [Candidatus Paceibacterota bacterium]